MLRPGRCARLLSLVLIAAACTRTVQPGATGLGKRNITVKGSDTMVILGQRWAEEYMLAAPAVTVQVTGGGSGTGIAALINGTVDICQASRPMTDVEKAAVAVKRGEPAMETRVALDALAIYVNEASPVRQMSIPALARIYRGEATSWRDFGGPDHAIVLYGRENNSGTYAYFKEHVLGGRDFASATQTLAGTSALASAVKGDVYGIGYGGIAYSEGIRVLAIKATEDAPAVVPSLETAQDGSYPLSRPLYFYTAGDPSLTMTKFITWVTGPEGQKTTTLVGYYPLPAKS
jgi:phosphate transport system substrate-binding protein